MIESFIFLLFSVRRNYDEDIRLTLFNWLENRSQSIQEGIIKGGIGEIGLCMCVCVSFVCKFFRVCL